MRVILRSAMLCAFMMFSVVALAKAEATTEQTTKIGVVNVREVFEKSKQYQNMVEKVQKEFAPREKEMNTLMKSYKDKSDKFQKDNAILSEAEKSKSERELVALQRELQRVQGEFREDTTARQQDEMQKFSAKLRDVMQNVGKEGHYDFIIHSDALTYSAQTFDVTDKVIAKLDQTK